MSAPYEISKNVLGALRSVARKQPREFCELCGLPLSEDHPHLMQPSTREVLCACEACAILFHHRRQDGKFFRVPRDARRLNGFVISDTQWAALRLPIDLAFFVQNSSEARPIAYYPSPAGCTESLLELDAWIDLVSRNPLLQSLTPDVEALLVNRTRGRSDYFIAPIDQCYKLAGLIRRSWRGFSGGDQVWREIDHFFEALHRSAPVVREHAHA